MNWIYDIPTWALGFLIIGPILLVSSTVLILCRTWIYDHFRLSSNTNDGVNGFFSAMGMLYGLLLSLVAVSTWQNLEYVDGLANKESTAIVELYRDVSTLEEPAKDKLHQDLEDYLSYIINVAWPAHKLGKVPSGGTVILTHFIGRLSTYHNSNVEQQIFLAEVFTAYNRLIDVRRLRMHAVADTGIGPIIWTVILVGGALTLSGGFLIHLPTLKGHLFMNGLFSILLGLMIFLLTAIDQPFRGEMGISPNAYSTTLAGLKDLDFKNTMTIDVSK
jgi:hypothetical protein